MPTDDSQPTYYRASLGLMKEVSGALAADYHSALITHMRANGGVFDYPAAGLSFQLAKEFGFCYGVDKAVDMAYEARVKFPGKRIFLLTEIIHNPRVNKRLVDMGIVFLSGQYATGLTEDAITAEDVVLIPAFGTSSETLARLRAKGCILIDTTCGSVVRVWKRVERYAADGFTSVVHGKYDHEETIATVSQARAQGGHFLVVRDRAEAERVVSFIEGSMPAGELLAGFHPGACSAGFDPARHLQRIGVANQTTMLASESLEIARVIGAALERRYGREHADEHFRSFDTICSATQDRQDAIQAMIAGTPPDLILVIGGYNSSNTGHLLEVAMSRCPAYHIQDAGEMLDTARIRHLPQGAKAPVETRDWLPGGELRIGLTAGASTPNRAIADSILRVLELRGVNAADAMEAIES
ncbi:MAG: 4-hydroxy-3-methylbut-2-en-yl diphosphate reductase [Candidatus Sumerlaeota bacterium]|nr:4-hydroxy-3-methylbut-2-en-yl diphosphate reductase [Candidatus Sumerlaeota bacterium]